MWKYAIGGCLAAVLLVTGSVASAQVVPKGLFSPPPKQTTRPAAKPARKPAAKPADGPADESVVSKQKPTTSDRDAFDRKALEPYFGKQPTLSGPAAARAQLSIASPEMAMQSHAQSLDECGQIQEEMRSLRYQDYIFEIDRVKSLLDRALDSGCFLQCTVEQSDKTPIQNTCSASADCDSDINRQLGITCCLKGQCVPAGALGCGCVASADCTSGVCVSGHCSTPAAPLEMIPEEDRARACRGPCCDSPCSRPCWDECISCGFRSYPFTPGLMRAARLRMEVDGQQRETLLKVPTSFDLKDFVENTEWSLVKEIPWYEMGAEPAPGELRLAGAKFGCAATELAQMTPVTGAGVRDVKAWRTQRAMELCQESWDLHYPITDVGYLPDADFVPMSSDPGREVALYSRRIPILVDESVVWNRVPDEIVKDGELILFGDGWGAPCDSCPLYANPNQRGARSEYDYIAGAPWMEDEDIDGDGLAAVQVCRRSLNADRNELCPVNDLFSACDNCPEVRNPEQRDYDDDQVGDLCDPCPMASGIVCEANLDACRIRNEQACRNRCQEYVPDDDQEVLGFGRYENDQRRLCCKNGGSIIRNQRDATSKLCKDFCKTYYFMPDLEHDRSVTYEALRPDDIYTCAVTGHYQIARSANIDEEMPEANLAQLAAKAFMTPNGISESDKDILYDKLCVHYAAQLSRIPALFRKLLKPCYDRWAAAADYQLWQSDDMLTNAERDELRQFKNIIGTAGETLYTVERNALLNWGDIPRIRERWQQLVGRKMDYFIRHACRISKNEDFDYHDHKMDSGRIKAFSRNVCDQFIEKWWYNVNDPGFCQNFPTSSYAEQYCN